MSNLSNKNGAATFLLGDIGGSIIGFRRAVVHVQEEILGLQKLGTSGDNFSIVSSSSQRFAGMLFSKFHQACSEADNEDLCFV